MSTTYAQCQTAAQKKDASNAASVLDASSQSESLQRKADMANNAAQRAEAPRPNNTGMPDNLKSGIESLSGFSMDDVRVHYNSSKPATVQALAYTQGTDIHVAPGQEKHLPHEAWHVAQQMAGRVSPTININGMPVNDNAALEHEADVMGEIAETQIFNNTMANKTIWGNNPRMTNGTMQLLGNWKFTSLKLNELGLLDSCYRWTTLRSGYQWYCYDSGGMWYTNNEIESEVLPRDEWVKKHQKWAEEQSAKFGMEIELDRPSNGNKAFKVNGSESKSDTSSEPLYPTKTAASPAPAPPAPQAPQTQTALPAKKTKTSSSTFETVEISTEKKMVTSSKLLAFLRKLNTAIEKEEVKEEVKEEEVKEKHEYSPLPPPCKEGEKREEEDNSINSDTKTPEWDGCSLVTEGDVEKKTAKKEDIGKVKESAFKAKSIFSIADGLVDVTFDTDTNYDTTRYNNELTIELVFNASKIPLIDDMISIGENLVYEIERLTYKKINDERKKKINLLKKTYTETTDEKEREKIKQQIDAFNRIEMIEMSNDAQKVFDENHCPNFHVTVPCPLKNLREHIKIKYNDDPTCDNCDLDENEKSEVRSFYRLLSQFPSSSSDNDDPKQSMDVMNRTSIGQIFYMMQKKARQYVIDHWDEFDFNFSYGPEESTEEPITEEPTTKKNESSGDVIKEDPTVLVNEFGKYGISALESKTEADCPIFEFRGRIGTIPGKLEGFPNYLKTVADVFRKYLGLNGRDGAMSKAISVTPTMNLTPK